MAGNGFGDFMPILRQSVLVPFPYAYWEASWLIPAYTTPAEAHAALEKQRHAKERRGYTRARG
jgi:hypothetical protein